MSTEPSWPKKVQAWFEKLWWPFRVGIITALGGLIPTILSKLPGGTVINDLQKLLGWMFGLLLAVLIECELRIRKQNENLSKESEKLAKLIGSLEGHAKSLDTLDKQLSGAVMAHELKEIMLNDSPFTGVLGTLLHDSNGHWKREGVSEPQYFEYLMETIKASTRYQTIHTKLISHFRTPDGDRFLEFLRDAENLRDVTRVFLIDDRNNGDLQSFEEEINDPSKLQWYFARCGAKCRSYYTTVSWLQAAQTERNINGSIEELSTDLAVCEGSLAFRYQFAPDGQKHLPFKVGTLITRFESSPDDLEWFWIFALLEEQLKRPRFEASFFKEIPRQSTVLQRYRQAKRPAAACIDLGQLAANFYKVAEFVKPAKVMAVLKEDAYGHGLIPTATVLDEANVDAIGVGSVEDGITLREHDVACDIVVMDGVRAHDVVPLLEYRLTPFVWDPHIIQLLNKEAEYRNAECNVHLKIDTGMRRLGAFPSECADLIKHGFERVKISAVCTHFADGDPSADDTKAQRKQFDDLGLEALLPRHAANSGAALRAVDLRYQMVRVGGALFGVVQTADFTQGDEIVRNLNLRPVMSAYGEVRFVKDAKAGDRVSYKNALTPALSRDSRIAIVNLGYAKGLPYRLSNVGEVLIGGVRCKIVGPVCMGMTLVDATDVVGLSAGDEVIMLGENNGHGRPIRLQEIAEWSGSCPYDVMCQIGRSLPRTYMRSTFMN